MLNAMRLASSMVSTCAVSASCRHKAKAPAWGRGHYCRYELALEPAVIIILASTLALTVVSVCAGWISRSRTAAVAVTVTTFSSKGDAREAGDENDQR